MGMFYRWSVDLAGPFPQSKYGKYYKMVMIEHFSKWVEVAAIPSKESGETVGLFRQYVLCRYGAPAKVLTDQGTEFRGEFHKMLDKALINHRKTAKDHPQVWTGGAHGADSESRTTKGMLGRQGFRLGGQVSHHNHGV